MKKFVVASHAKLATGFQSTIELFAGSDHDITYISAYVDDVDLDMEVQTFISSLADDDQAVIFTDMFGGSVNQKFVIAAQNKPNVFVVAGMNLPVILEIILSSEPYTTAVIDRLIDNGRTAMQQVYLTNDTSQNVVDESANDSSKQAPQAIETDQLINENTGQIDALRVDERLIHGQIAMVWSRALNLDGIVVANDEAAGNELQQKALKMAVPNGIKVIIKTMDGAIRLLKDKRAATMHLLVLVRTVGDALILSQQLDNIQYVNIGNVGKSVTGEKKTLTKFVMLTDEELNNLKALVDVYPETAFQNLPSDTKELASRYV
ncbi:PTS system sorbose subfamily IIB component [Lactococcus plantarum]|uniref:PTS system sorbose subfamily IIB component n=1 Tax=Pseudolactococcus plantarum TaxID=1365 RepID=A0A2A5S1J8_9LACT|nr:PTS mannose/fructose/sorbose transporter subunit IIAB [Lactococcus plantarum]PCS07396.1 PTS system sorbose subfamily IIB component [Lactococcus plantarum]HCN75187.1 PTS mannose/fructose/sorbose transporter subunit IIAB [Lactococcus sp.]